VREGGGEGPRRGEEGREQAGPRRGVGGRGGGGVGSSGRVERREDRVCGGGFCEGVRGR